MRILFLSTSMGMGGADSQLLAAAQELHARGHTCCIVSLTALGPMGLRARSLGIPTESLEMPRGIPDPRGLVRLIRLVRAWRPDVLHSHMVHANLMARALRARGTGAGPRLHDSQYIRGRPAVDGRLSADERAGRPHDHHQRGRGRPLHPGADRSRELLRVVPNGVDPEPYRPVSGGARRRCGRHWDLASEFVWLAVGRFEIAKDYPNMLRAFATVRERHPEAVLLLVGRGSLQRRDGIAGSRTELGEAVRFLGVREDVPALVSAADGYVMSSAWEGMPMVLLEAAAGGLPGRRRPGSAEPRGRAGRGERVPGAAQGPPALASAMLRLMGLTEPSGAGWVSGAANMCGPTTD